MGTPELSIAFREESKKLVSENTTGKILLIIKDSKLGGRYEYFDKEDINQSFSAANIEYINNCFIGNVQDVRINNNYLESKRYKADKVIVYCIAGSGATIDKALTELETESFDFLVMPDASEEDNTKLIAFISKLKEQNMEAFAVISSSSEVNNKDIIKFTIEKFTEGKTEYTAAKLLPQITGILAGTPLEQSITYATLDNINNIQSKTKSEIDELINAGNVTLIKKGGKVRIAKGVTSSTDNQLGDTFKQIKEVRIYKYIHNTIANIIINYYIGKVPNSYANKLSLITEIKTFLKSIANVDLIENNYAVDIDINKQKEYLKSINVDIKPLTEDEIRQYNTNTKVFLSIKIKAIDSMEDITIDVEV